MASNMNYLPFEAQERIKCKMNPLYFIEKYVKISTSGGPIPICNDVLWKKTNKYRLAVKVFYRFKKPIFFFPRQTGKTTLDLAIDLWMMNFYGSKVGFITIDKNRALDAVNRIRFMWAHLPKWLRTPEKKSTSDRLTYFKLENGAYMRTAYVSSATPADSVFRGLSLENISWDEQAYTPHADDVLTAVGPAFRKAAEEAKSANMPYGMKIFTTPNGATGLFYEMYGNATFVEELLTDPDDPMCDTLKPQEECEKIINQDGRNGYVIVKLDWREVYDDAWYKEQERLLNFNKRRIAQEVDLVFLGSTSSIFDDEIFMHLKELKSTYNVPLFNGVKFNLLRPIDPEHTYILGVDTAASASDDADFSALYLHDATDNVQIGEMRVKIPVLKHYAAAIGDLAMFLLNDIGLEEDNLKLAIERNSYGLAIIEYLIYHQDYGDIMTRIIYQTMVKGEYVYGIQTSAANRSTILNGLIQMVNEDPRRVVGSILISELRTLVQKSNGRIEADKKFHDDLCLAAAFTIYIRKMMLKNGEISGINMSEETLMGGASMETIKKLINKGVIAQHVQEDDSNEPIIVFESDIEQPKTNQKIDYNTIFKAVL